MLSFRLRRRVSQCITHSNIFLTFPHRNEKMERNEPSSFFQLIGGRESAQRGTVCGRVHGMVLLNSVAWIRNRCIPKYHNYSTNQSKFIFVIQCPFRESWFIFIIFVRFFLNRRKIAFYIKIGTIPALFYFFKSSLQMVGPNDWK
jgi:hypothetical protein